MDKLKDKLKSAAIVLAAVDGGKVTLIAGVTSDLIGKVKAGELVNLVAQQVGGKGGGKRRHGAGRRHRSGSAAAGAAVGAGLGRRAAVRGQRCISRDALVDRDADAAKCISDPDLQRSGERGKREGR